MPPPAPNLSELFRDHAAALQELGESLRRQKDAIIHWDLKALTQEQKVHNRLLMQLRVFDAARTAAFDRMAAERGLVGRPQPIEILGLVDDPRAEEIRQSYRNLVAIAGAIQELYRETQKYLSHSLTGIDASLGVLRAARQQGGCYTRSNDGVDVSGAELHRRFVDQSI